MAIVHFCAKTGVRLATHGQRIRDAVVSSDVDPEKGIAPYTSEKIRIPAGDTVRLPADLQPESPAAAEPADPLPEEQPSPVRPGANRSRRSR